VDDGVDDGESIVDVIDPTDAPTELLMTDDGTIELLNYEDNLDRSWEIAPSCSSVWIYTTLFKLEENYDNLFIASDEFTGSLCIDEMYDTPVTVRFTSDTSVNDDGFTLHWSCEQGDAPECVIPTEGTDDSGGGGGWDTSTTTMTSTIATTHEPGADWMQDVTRETGSDVYLSFYDGGGGDGLQPTPNQQFTIEPPETNCSTVSIQSQYFKLREADQALVINGESFTGNVTIDRHFDTPVQFQFTYDPDASTVELEHFGYYLNYTCYYKPPLLNPEEKMILTWTFIVFFTLFPSVLLLILKIVKCFGSKRKTSNEQTGEKEKKEGIYDDVP